MLEQTADENGDQDPADQRPRRPDDASLRVLGVDPELGFAGGETQVLGLTLELLRAGHAAELACDPRGQLFARASASGILCRPLSIRNALDLRAALRLRALLTAGDYDIVHFHTSRAHSMAPYVGGIARATVVTRRMDYRPNRLFAPYLYNRAVDGVAAISRPVAHALETAGVRPGRISIIPSGVDCGRFRPPAPDRRQAARARLGISTGQLAVGTVGVLEERKGHRYLLEAFALETAKIEAFDAICLIAGQGSREGELRRISERAGISARVRMLGQIDDSRILLDALDVFVFPSLREGLGVALLEAMASGLAVVASASGGMTDVLEDGVSGCLVPPGDCRRMALAIERLARDPGERHRMGERARERICNGFSLAAMARSTVDLYRACLSRSV